jgi:arylsulfatase A-like enzyme/Tfp pilus assembly protein PilF
MRLKILVIVSFIASVLSGWLFFRRPNLEDIIQDASKKKFNVLLITLDTLRADRLSCYGFKEISTPNIDTLAREGTLFLDATAHVPLTLPSHTSMMTGKFPAHHGVHDNGGFYVSKTENTLAEIFKQNGFSTAAFVSAYSLDSMWGLNQGFDTYHDKFDIHGGVERKGGDVLKDAITWLDRHRGERFFLWTHFNDPHAPYEPPPEYAQKYPGKPYIGEIAYTDSLVAQLLDHLDALRLRDKTVIVLTGDHGESLGDHGESTHAFFIYDATLRVPMILWTPRRELHGKSVSQQVRTIDIFPAVLQMTGIPVPEGIQGSSLLQYALRGSDSEEPYSYAESYYPQYHFGWSRLLSIRSSQYKYIDLPNPELYDLKADPGEKTNLYEKKKEIAQQMQNELKKIESEKITDIVLQTGAIDDEAHEKLSALGYVGAFSGQIKQDPISLSDPKEKIEIFNLITSARRASLEGNAESAIAKFNQTLERDPKNVEAQFMLGNDYYKNARYEEALASFKKAVELNPDYDFAQIKLADTYRKMGKIDEALLTFEHILRKKRDHTQVLYQIGQIYLEKAEPDRALKYFERALKTQTDPSWIYNGIGIAHLQKQELDKAEEYFQKALELNPEIKMTHLNMAQLREKQGNLNEAENEYLSELKNFPKNSKAHFGLGRLLVNAGRIDEGIQHLNSSIESGPDFALGYIFLAQALAEQGSDFQKAIDYAEKGLSLDPGPEYRPLGHQILADIYNRMGRRDLEKQHLRLAKKK